MGLFPLLFACTHAPDTNETGDTGAVDTSTNDTAGDSGEDSDTALNFDPDGDGLVTVRFYGVPLDETVSRTMQQDWPAATWWYYSTENRKQEECYESDEIMVLYDGTCVLFGYTCTLTGGELWPVAADYDRYTECETLF